MANTKIIIGHASLAETGDVEGEAGDQTGYEVYKKSDYDITELKPTVVLRPQRAELAENSARACEAACKNENVGYSWFGTSDSQGRNRNTLYLEAKKVNFDLSKITTPVNTDCTAFMSVCALAGGAKFTYGYRMSDGSLNGPTTGTIRSWFTQNNNYDYKALTDKLYLTDSRYLKRGDILVNEDQHAVMVLSADGIDYEENEYTILNFDHLDIKTIDLKVKTVETNKVFINGTIMQLLKGKIQKLSDTSWITFNNRTWYYTIIPLTDNSNSLTRDLSIADSSFSFSISNLIPDTNYLLRVTTIKGNQQISSQNILFKTLPLIPVPVKNINTTFNDKKFTESTCSLAFTDPVKETSKGYRVSLVVNGVIKYFSDTVVTAAIGRAIEFPVKTLTKNVNLNNGDIVQIGIQTWLKNSKGELVLDSIFPQCSQPIQIKPFINAIDKAFIKIESGYNRVIMYNNSK